jgi:two-component system, OmpR family, response regulator RegX3
VSGAPAELAPIIDALQTSGFDVQLVSSGREVLATGRLRRHWSILADDTLGDMSALELVREVRDRADIPIVVIAASNAEDHIVALLDAGADQCATKPVPTRELVARVRAAMRRTSGPQDEPATIEINDVRLDPIGRVLVVRGSDVRLTNKEFDLLHLLMANAGQILPRQLIIDRVWGPDAPEGKTLDTHIRRLRTKIEDNPKVPKRIATVRKVGYRYQRPSRP